MLASSDSKRDKNPEHNTKNMRYKQVTQQVTRWMIREISGGQITGAPIENMFKTT